MSVTTTPERGTGSPRVRFRWQLLSWLTLSPLLLYLGIALAPSIEGLYARAALVIFSFLGAYVWLKTLSAYRPPALAEDRLKQIALFSVVLLACFLILDVGDAAYVNLHANGGGSDITALRASDPHTWDAELMPQEYFPTEANFFLYKPEALSAGYAYGEFYSPDLLRHKIIKDEVLKLRYLKFSIDQYGVRNTRRPEEARVFALGDSFCFGYHMTQDATWTSLLEATLGEPVYNMGVSGTSPLQQLQILEYFLREYPKAFLPKRLLWMLFEGNDLEDSYAPRRREPTFFNRVFRKTIAGTIASIPRHIRRESVIRRLADGDLIVGSRPEEGQRSDHYLLDGSRLSHPLYCSPRFGHTLFLPPYIARAGKPLSYVLNHPNRKRLENTFHRMREISRQQGFEVTVVVVPSSVRLYKDDFKDLPPISDEPHFINYLLELSTEVGFKTVDLNALLAPYASDELLYQRDDTHWNERGHEIVAGLIHDNVFQEAPVTGQAAAAK